MLASFFESFKVRKFETNNYAWSLTYYIDAVSLFSFVFLFQN